MTNRTQTPNEAACHRLFGEHPEDVINPMKSAADALCWIDEIFKTIQNEALDGRNGHRIRHLAEAGAYIAADMSNFTSCQHETMINRLRAVDVAATQGAFA